MNNENFCCRFTVHATPQKIIDSICNVQGWWAADIKGNTQNPDDEFTARFGKTYSIFKVTEMIPLKKMVWLVTESYLPLFKHKTEWLNTQIIWEIVQHNLSSELIMTHVGLTPESECYIDCKKG